MKTKTFFNWTEKDFEYLWDGAPYRFKAGESRLLPDGVADHFAKHLADKEMNDRDINPGKLHIRQQFIHKALVGPVSAEMTAEQMAIATAESAAKQESGVSEKEEVKRELDALGIKYDARRTTEHLREVLAEAKALTEEDSAFEGV